MVFLASVELGSKINGIIELMAHIRLRNELFELM